MVGGHYAAAPDDVPEVLGVEKVARVAVDLQWSGGGVGRALELQLEKDPLWHGGVDGGEDPVAQVDALGDSDGVTTGEVDHLLSG